MFGLEFMTGALLLSAIQLVSFLLFSVAVWKVLDGIIPWFTAKADPDCDGSLNKFPKFWTFILVAMLLLGIFFNSNSAPKITIETPPNRELIEYQSPKPIVLEVPEARTQTLEGFTPMKGE
jgi:hypothetical protein